MAAKGSGKSVKKQGKRPAARLMGSVLVPNGRSDSNSALPRSYAHLFESLKARIRIAQVKAALAVNRELIELYWDIGRSIVQRQKSEGWGRKVIDRLADDLQREFPGVGGFSRGNVYRMRTFYLIYSDGASIVAQPARQLAPSIVAQPVGQLLENTIPPSDEQNAERPLPPFLGQIPWGHNIILFEKLKDPRHRQWYAEQIPIHGWSRAVLLHQIETDLYSRAGKAVTNFAATLPAPDSDLVHQLLKDPYNFDFLTLASEAHERDLENGLIGHLKKFLLELGVGFAFVGQQYHFEVGGDDFYLDLLFYHLRLRRYVIIDLKVEEFKPEFAGKMNFYLSAIDDQLRNGDDQTSIGLILCKTQNRLIAEYALRDTGKPMGVATYTAHLPQALRDSLPSPEQLIRELGSIRQTSDQ
jgi:predicted nuclease of restriction endonuclease-like (RecB) superfamily